MNVAHPPEPQDELCLQLNDPRKHFVTYVCLPNQIDKNQNF